MHMHTPCTLYTLCTPNANSVYGRDVLFFVAETPDCRRCQVVLPQFIDAPHACLELIETYDFHRALNFYRSNPGHPVPRASLLLTRSHCSLLTCHTVRATSVACVLVSHRFALFVCLSPHTWLVCVSSVAGALDPYWFALFVSLSP